MSSRPVGSSSVTMRIILLTLLWVCLEQTRAYSPNPLVNQVINETLMSDPRDGSFIVVDVDHLVHQYNQWRRVMPRVRPFYAIKANPLAVIAEVLSAMGSGFDCASQVEIRNVLAMGVPPESIIFAQPYKHRQHILYAQRRGVKKMTFDCVNELNKTYQLFPEAQQVLRIKSTEVSPTVSLNKKFGAPIETVPILLKAAKDLGVRLVGVTLHVGTNTTNEEAYVHAIRSLKSIFDMAESYGFNFTLLDIGGGFPSGHMPGEIFEKQGLAISKELDELFPLSKYKDLEIIAEPGRYFAGNHPIVAKVISELTPPNSAAHHLFINDGIHQSFRGVEHFKMPVRASLFETGRMTSRPYVNTTIWGPTCDPYDRIASDITLPLIHTDEAIVFEDAGSYTLSWGSTFNGYAVPFPVVAVSNKTLEQLNKLPRWPRIDQEIARTKTLANNYLAQFNDTKPSN